MAIDKIFDGAVDGIADNLFNSVSNSVSEIKAMQQRKAAENVQLVVQALKKIDNDIRDKYDGVTTTLETRIANIKDGRDGIDGKNGRDGLNGKDGRDGKDGRNGRDGATGPRGFDGPKGLDGKDGQDGEDGVSVEDAHIDFDGSLIITLSSGRVINVGEVVAADIAEKIKVITNGGGTSQPVLDELASLQAQIDLIASALVYKGTWNASTNTPALTSSVGTANTFYIVSVAGTTNLNGTSNWGVGDWAVYNGTVWQRIEGGAVGNFTDLSVSGTTTLSGLTASTALALNASKEVVSVTNTGSGNNVLATSPTLTTPNLGTPSSVTLTNGTGLPLSTGVTGTLPIANGGTGQTTATNAFNALAPSQASNSGKYLTTNGTTTSWATVSSGVTSVAATVPSFLSVTGSPITSSGTLAFSLSGTALPTTSGGTGLTSFTNKGVPYATSTSALTTSTALQFDGNNFGVSSTPSAWGSDFRAIDLGTRASFSFDSNLNQTGISSNIYNAVNLSRPYYKTNAVASQYLQSSGDHVWRTAPSGIAGTTTTITSGNIYTNITSGNQTSFGASSNTVGTIWSATSSGTLSSGTVIQNVEFVESMRIDSSSNVGIGTSSPGSKLDVKGTLRLSGSTSGYVGLAPASAAGSTTYTLPSADGTNGQALVTNGSGTLSWATAASGSVTSVAMTVPSFLSVTGSPITSSGTLAVSLSGTALPIANGGTGATSAAAAITALGATTVGGNVFTLTNPSAITFPRFNADNTVSALDAATFRTAIGAGTSSTTGTVTSVGGTGTVSGISLSGTVTSSGNLTLGGALDLSAYNGAGAFTTLSASSTVTLSGGTANGVAYLNGSKVVTSGSVLTFNGTDLGVAGRASLTGGGLTGSGNGMHLYFDTGSNTGYIKGFDAGVDDRAIRIDGLNLQFAVAGTEGMRLTSTGLGIGTSSPNTRLQVVGLNQTNGTLELTPNAAKGSFASYVHYGTNGDWYIRSASASGNIVIQDTGGNVGIGTSSPATKLQVYGGALTVGDETTYAARFGNNSNKGVTIGYDTTNNVGHIGSINPAVAWTDLVINANGGNLGLGVTPSAWYSLSKAIEIGAGGAVQARTNDAITFELTSNAYLNTSGSWIYKTTNRASLFSLTNGAYAWNIAPSGTAGNAITFTQAMTLDASGNLGIGETSPTSRLHVSFTSNSVDNVLQIQQKGNNTASGITLAANDNNGAGYNFIRSLTTGGTTHWQISGGVATSTMAFSTGGTERARIDSSGNLCIGTTTAGAKFTLEYVGTSAVGQNINDSANTTNSTLMQFLIQGTQAGTIKRVAATSAVVYNTTSDYRLKNVTGAVTGQGARIDALKPIDYLWKEGNTQARGFLAHEFQAVYPNSVSGDKDAVDANGNPEYQAMQAATSEVIADLVAEIQSLRQRIATLEAK